MAVLLNPASPPRASGRRAERLGPCSDLADAALVRVAEREGIRRIFTVDRNDFMVYRLHGRIGLAIVP